MKMSRISRVLRRFLGRAFVLRFNPELNLDAVCVVTGIVVWSVCMIGATFLNLNVPAEVMDIGEAMFMFGIGRASKGVASPER